ncbi:MAG: hypothetical protein A2498_15145 [Lentisphaerae bacterium RIFOXYC12_FULL_60_16]|nr:MAG: hypothetical protein A2498_15145 [Lentisphaerae bacterium RIFOXYC12_FULL_60_16]
MQTRWKLIVMATVAAGLMGCNEEAKPAAGAEAVEKVEAAAPAAPAAPVAAPAATAKPKDHPAH